MANTFENKVKEKLERDGWTVLRSGWPDFLCIRVIDGRPQLQAVEVKSKSDVFRDKQVVMLSALSTQFDVLTIHEGPGFGSEKEMHSRHTQYLLPTLNECWMAPKKNILQIFLVIIHKVRNA